MSITFDFEKWSNPLLRRETEPEPRQSRSPVLVPVKELAYFKAHPEFPPDMLFPFLEENATKAPREPLPPGGRRLKRSKS
jgi:hypothetical protein